jgi:hypothetical protein
MSRKSQNEVGHSSFALSFEVEKDERGLRELSGKDIRYERDKVGKG